MFDLIAFDADDTLWHNESLYARAQEGLAELLSDYIPAEEVEKRLFHTEMGNLELYGYGIKSFVLSMIETAIQVSGGQIEADKILQIIGLAREMLQAQVVLLDYAQEAVTVLAEEHDLILITKGDLLDQQRKLERSGLARYFAHVEIVSHKTRDVYQALLEKHRVAPERFLMVGNSLRSDIAPVVSIGGTAVYVPHELTWTHETVVEETVEEHMYHTIENLRQLPALVTKLVEARFSSAMVGEHG
jgi:putative hydrolase of the HAD superfamily